MINAYSVILAFTSEEFQRMEWHGFNHLLSIPIKLHLRAQFSKHIYCYKREENKLRKRTLWVFRKVFYCRLLLFSHPVVSDCVWPHALQHARPPCPSPSPRVCPSSCPLQSVMPSSHLILWCPLPLLPSIFPASGTLPVSHLFGSDDQNTGTSALASVLPVNIQGWSPFRLTGLISLLSKGLSGVFSSTTVRRHQFFGINSSLQSNSHNCTRALGRP